MNRRMRKQRYIWLTLFALAAAAAIVGIAFLVAGRSNFSPASLWRSMRGLNQERTRATEFQYDYAGDSAFASVGGGFVIAGESGIRYLNLDGEEALLTSKGLSDPVALSSGNEALVYSLGGKDLWLCGKKGLAWHAEAEGVILSAHVNSAGWSAVCHELSGYKGAVTVYNQKGEAVYRWYSGSGYVTGAALSESCRQLAVLTLSGDGSRIHFFHLSKEEEQARFVLPEEAILEIAFAGSDAVTAVTHGFVLTVGTDGAEDARAALPDGGFAGYCLHGEGYSVYAASPTEDTPGTLMTLDHRGRELARLEITRPVLSLAASGRYIAVRDTQGVVVYNAALKPVYETAAMVDAVAILVHTDGSFIAAGAYSAEIYSR